MPDAGAILEPARRETGKALRVNGIVESMDDAYAASTRPVFAGGHPHVVN
jgi:hypothetical protein